MAININLWGPNFVSVIGLAATKVPTEAKDSGFKQINHHYLPTVQEFDHMSRCPGNGTKFQGIQGFHYSNSNID